MLMMDYSEFEYVKRYGLAYRFTYTFLLGHSNYDSWAKKESCELWA